MPRHDLDLANTKDAKINAAPDLKSRGKRKKKRNKNKNKNNNSSSSSSSSSNSNSNNRAPTEVQNNWVRAASSPSSSSSSSSSANSRNKKTTKLGVWRPEVCIQVTDKSAVKQAKALARRSLPQSAGQCTLAYVRLVKADWFRRQLTKFRREASLKHSLQPQPQQKQQQQPLQKTLQRRSKTDNKDLRNNKRAEGVLPRRVSVKPALMVIERWCMRFQLAAQEWKRHQVQDAQAQRKQNNNSNKKRVD